MFGKNKAVATLETGTDDSFNLVTSSIRFKMDNCPSLYVIYDKVERKYSFPFSANTDLGAVRRMKGSDIFKNVSQNDFELYHVGYFDELGRDNLVVVDFPKRLVDWNIDVEEDVNE